jgi:hypothetical protein
MNIYKYQKLGFLFLMLTILVSGRAGAEVSYNTQEYTSYYQPIGNASAQTARLIPHLLRGDFEADSKPGSDPFWERLENGSFEGTYFVEEGSFPAPSGTDFVIPVFDIMLRDAMGNTVIRYVSGRDFGAFFADFFGPGTGDGFVFNGSGTQFQVGGFPSGFDGNGIGDEVGVFSDGGAPPGGIDALFAIARAMVVVTIDIKPGSKRNFINPRATGGIWVAILSETDSGSPFDPSSQVDIPTVVFGPDGAKAIHYKVKDINRDGLGDLLLRFNISATGIACGDTEATLTGETFDGQSFTGTDSIKTVGCKSKKHHKKKHHEHYDKQNHKMHDNKHHDDGHKKR